MQTKSKLSSKYIYKYYKELEKHNIENHGLLIMQKDEVIFEEYAEPYSALLPHTLFSVTKSVVATAAGFAIDEGLFSLDTKIIDCFPEYKACKGSGWKDLTVRSVLTMQSNKAFTFLQDMTSNYVEMFMKAPFRKKGGFLYSNNDAHIVAALVQKFSGMSLVDYLMPRLFEPLGIEKPFWETNYIGECIGGTGCYLKLSDLAKICRCYADGGRYKGVQVIPEKWTKEATEIQVLFKDDGKTKDGYGYLFWINNGIFSMTGMFGQIISYMPEFDAVVATMNCCIDEGYNTKVLREVLPKAFEEDSDEEWDEKLSVYLKNRHHKPVQNKEKLNIPTGKAFYITPFSDFLAKLMFPQSIIPRSLTASFAKRPRKNFDEVTFSLTEDVLTIKWKEEEDTIVINCGLDGEAKLSECEIKGYYYKIWAYAFAEDGVLNVVVKPLNTLSTQYMKIFFNKDSVRIQMRCTPSFPEFIKKSALEPEIFRKSKVLRKITEKTLDMLLNTTEKPFKYVTKD